MTEEAKKQRITNDQLNVIFDVIGTPPADDELTFLNDKESVAYVKNFFPTRERADLKELFPGCDDRGIQLLYQMLEFNPEKRVSALQAIADPYFDDIRLPEQEINYEVKPIKISVDDDENMPLEKL